MKRASLVVLFLALVAPLAPLAAQDAEKAAVLGEPPPVPARFEAPQPAPETEQMRKWEGNWKTLATFAKGGVMPEGGEAKGTYSSARALNGHAFIGDYRATGTGGDFAGHGVRMFDPVTRKWQTWWYDSWVPGHADLSVGEIGPDGSFVTESDSEYKGNKFKMRITERWADDNKVEQAFESDLGRGWVPVMSITYTRKGKWKERPAPRVKGSDQDERPRKKGKKSDRSDNKDKSGKPEKSDKKDKPDQPEKSDKKDDGKGDGKTDGKGDRSPDDDDP